MKEVLYSTQFRKDFKKYRNNSKKVSNLLKVISMLEQEEPLPLSMRPHLLSGNYSGCWECHIENDYLLIWIDETEQVIKLLRLGSHAELF